MKEKEKKEKKKKAEKERKERLFSCNHFILACLFSVQAQDIFESPLHRVPERFQQGPRTISLTRKARAKIASPFTLW